MKDTREVIYRHLVRVIRSFMLVEIVVVVVGQELCSLNGCEHVLKS